MVSEQYLLDLEREAFLKLCGETKDARAIQHTLKNRKAVAELAMLPLVFIPGIQGRWNTTVAPLTRCRRIFRC